MTAAVRQFLALHMQEIQFMKGGISEKDRSPVGLEWHEFRRKCISDEDNSFFDFAISLVEELASVRSGKGITQRELERLSGVKQPVIARIERGKSIPRVDTLIRLLAPLGKTLAIVPIK